VAAARAQTYLSVGSGGTHRMSIRRVIQIFAFLSALAIAFSAPIATSTAYACPPSGSAGDC